MSKIAIRATFDIHEGKTEELKRFAEKCVAAVREREPRTIHYDWYLSEDGRTCYVNELFEDSDATLVHLETLRPLLGEGLQLGTLRMEILGSPSAELKQALEAVKPRYFEFVAGV